MPTPKSYEDEVYYFSFLNMVQTLSFGSGLLFIRNDFSWRKNLIVIAEMIIFAFFIWLYIEALNLV